MEPYELLEERLGEWIGNPNVVVCSSGTSALHLALESLHQSRQTQVVMPNYTMIACPRAAVMTELTPVFIDPTNTLLMDLDLLEKYLSEDNGSRVSCIMCVHIYGRILDMERINKLADQYSCCVIEDMAECHGVKPHPHTDASCYCLPASSCVINHLGRRVRMDSVSVGDQIWSLDQDTLKRELVTVTAKKKSRTQTKILNIKYKSGGEIKLSKRHQILVVREGIPQWVRAEKAIVGDDILHYREITGMGRARHSVDMCYLAGLVASDGSLSRRGVVAFSNLNSSLRERWSATAERITGYRVSEFHKSNNTSRLCSLHIWNQMRLIEKEIEGYSEDCIAAYIKGFADGDGCIFEKGNGKPAINLATLGRGEARHMRHLLFRLGIRSQYNIRQPGSRLFPNGKFSLTKGGKCVVITHPQSVKRFIDLVGFNHNEKLLKSQTLNNEIKENRDHLDTFFVGHLLKQERYKAGISSGKVAGINNATLSLAERGRVRITRKTLDNVAQELQSGPLALLAQSDVYFWKITDIKEVDNTEELYDISVSKNDCFFADGVLVHNSFYKNKVIAGEEGGCIVFKQNLYVKKAKSLRSLGFTEEHNYTHIPRGHNYRLSNLHAGKILGSLGSYLCPKLVWQDWAEESVLERRRRIEAVYDQGCPPEWRMPPRMVPWVYDVRLPGIDPQTQTKIVTSLRAFGVAARHGFKPMTDQEEFRYPRRVATTESVRNTTKLRDEIIYLPVDPGIVDWEKIKWVWDAVKKCL